VEVKTEVIIRMYNFDDVQYTVILSAFLSYNPNISV